MTPTRPDVLARIKALGLTDQAFCLRAKITLNFLTRARSGGCLGPKSLDAWGRIETTLTELEAPNAPRSRPKKATKAAAKAVPADDAEAVLALVVAEIEKASTAEAIDRAITKLTGPTLRGGIPESRIRAVCGLLSEKRQYLELAAEQEEKAKAGEPLVIRIEHVNNWRDVEKG